MWNQISSSGCLFTFVLLIVFSLGKESVLNTELDKEAFTLSPILSSTSVVSSVHEHIEESHSSSSSFSSGGAVGVGVQENVVAPVNHDDSASPVINAEQEQEQEQQPDVEVGDTAASITPPVIVTQTVPSIIPSTTPRPEVVPAGPKLPTAEIYLAGANDELTLLTSASNSEILIDKSYVVNGSEFINIVLVCTAGYPIRWIYEGDGAPTRMYSSELRTFQDFHDLSSYEYFTTLVLMQERNNEHLTGTYTCQGTEAPNSGRVYYHLYFPGAYGFPTIRNRVIRPANNDSHVNLPCKATNPKLPMTLYKIYPKEEAGNFTTNPGVSYDPKNGFTIDVNILEHPYGTYYCSLNDADSFWKIDLVPRKEEEVIVTPESYIVFQENFANQTFTCEAKEGIEFIFPQSVQYGTENYFRNTSSEFPFVGVYTIDPNVPISTLSKYFKISCVSKRTRRTLHTWEYTNIGAEELSIKYQSSQRRILCCSKSGLSPVQEIVKCETPTDCEIKKQCFENGRCEYPFPPNYADAPVGCTAMEFLERIPTHMMKCSVGKQSKIVTVTETIAKNDIYLNDESLQLPSTDLILKIGLVSQSANNDIKVKCSGNLYYFSTNFVFGLERVDGSVEYLSRDLVDNSDPYEPILITRIRRNIRKVHCFAPVTGSSEWRNVTLPVTALELTTTTSSTTSRTLSRGPSFRGRTRLNTLG